MRTTKLLFIFMVVAVFALAIGCASLPKTTRTGAIHDIRIEKTLSHPNLVVKIGDEIRWVNFRTESVIVEFTPEAIHSFSCQQGFSDLFGKSRPSARLGQGDAVSLCFSKKGEFKYNVRMTAAIPGGEIIAPGVIQVGEVQK